MNIPTLFFCAAVLVAALVTTARADTQPETSQAIPMIGDQILDGPRRQGQGGG